MKKQKLLKQYRQVAGKIGFRENRQKKGWEPKLGPNDYRSVIRHGWLGEKPVVLEVSPHLDLVGMAKDFKRYQREQTGDGLLVPRVLRSGRMDKAQYLVQEAVEGERIIKNFPFASESEKREVAELYWETVGGFTSFPSVIGSGEIGAAGYFLERLAKWMAEGQNSSAITDFVVSEDIKKAVQFIFDYCLDMNMWPFFAHFGNTDIVKTVDGECFILGAPIVARPEVAGIAFWLWNATLYVSLKTTVGEWCRELSDWIGAFRISAFRDYNYNPIYIRVNFLERMIATLLIDFPKRRSPFDRKDISEEDLEKAGNFLRDIFRKVLDKGF